jgi:hypothetical protein
LRFSGEALDPKTITLALGCPPSIAYGKGETWLTPKGTPVVGRTGLWSLKALERSPADLDAQIAELFAKLTEDLAVWRDLSGRYEGGLFLGLFAASGNQGVSLAAETINDVAVRALQFDLDVYAVSDD